MQFKSFVIFTPGTRTRPDGTKQTLADDIDKTVSDFIVKNPGIELEKFDVAIANMDGAGFGQAVVTVFYKTKDKKEVSKK